MNISTNNEKEIRQYLLTEFDTSTPSNFVKDFNDLKKSFLFTDFIFNNVCLSLTDSNNKCYKNHEVIIFNKNGADRIKPAIDLIIKILKEM